MSEKGESEFGTKWVEGPKLVSIGGRWYEGVGIVQDKRQELKVRIFKGEQKEGRPLPSQTQRLNVKKFSEWEALTPLVKEFCDKLEQLKPKGK